MLNTKLKAVNIRDYDNARRALNTQAGALEYVLPGRQTWLEYVGDTENSIAVNYRGTQVVIYRANGDIKLQAGTWLTQTTKNKMNLYLPKHIIVESGKDLWIVRNKNTQKWTLFSEGMIIRSDGRMSANNDETLESIELAQQSKKYINDYMELVKSGNLSDELDLAWVDVTPEENESGNIQFLPKDKVAKLIYSNRYPPSLLRRAVMMNSNKVNEYDLMENVTLLPLSQWSPSIQKSQYLTNTMNSLRRSLKRLVNKSLELPIS